MQTAIFKGRETVGGKRGDILKAAGFILDKNIEDVRKIVPKGSVSELRAKFENDGSFSISYAVLEEIIFLNGNSEKDKPGHTVVSGTLLATRNGVSVAEKPFKVTLDKHETLFGVERVYMNDEEGKAPKKNL